MWRLIGDASVIALVLLVVGLFAVSDARPANAASYHYWMSVHSGTQYSSGGVQKACAWNGYNASHQAVDLHNQSSCSSTAGGVVSMRTQGNKTDPSGGSVTTVLATAHPYTVPISGTQCTLHAIDVTVPKPFLGDRVWTERMMHSYRSGDRTFYVGFAYSASDWGAWSQVTYNVGSLYDEGSYCQQAGQWEDYHLHQHRKDGTLGSGVSATLNSYFSFPCCSVHNFTLWDHRRELFGWTRIV